MFGLFKKKKNMESEVSSKVDEKEQDDSIPDFTLPHGVGEGAPSGIPGFEYSPVDPDEEFKATAGKPLPEGVTIASEDEIVEALREVYDPEIPVNIYDLGLIYGLSILEKGDIKIDMSLTAPGCPVAGEMPGMVARAVEGVEGTGEIEVLLVWEPQWTPERMSEDAKLALGMG